MFDLGWNSESSVISSDTLFKGPYNKWEVSHTLDLLRLRSSAAQGFPRSVGWLLGFRFARYYLYFASLYPATVINEVDLSKSYNIFISRFHCKLMWFKSYQIIVLLLLAWVNVRAVKNEEVWCPLFVCFCHEFRVLVRRIHWWPNNAGNVTRQFCKRQNTAFS